MGRFRGTSKDRWLLGSDMPSLAAQTHRPVHRAFFLMPPALYSLKQQPNKLTLTKQKHHTQNNTAETETPCTGSRRDAGPMITASPPYPGSSPGCRPLRVGSRQTHLWPLCWEHTGLLKGFLASPGSCPAWRGFKPELPSCFLSPRDSQALTLLPLFVYGGTHKEQCLRASQNCLYSFAFLAKVVLIRI